MEALVQDPQNLYALQVRAEALRQEGFLDAALEDVQAVKRRAKPGWVSWAAAIDTQAEILRQLDARGPPSPQNREVDEAALP